MSEGLHVYCQPYASDGESRGIGDAICLGT